MSEQIYMYPVKIWEGWKFMFDGLTHTIIINQLL